MTNKIAKKVALYDWIRLLATIMVIIGHSTYINMKGGVGGISYTLPSLLSPTYNSVVFTTIRSCVTLIYKFHMPLFFFLSGAVLGLKPIEKFNDFAIKKLKKLLLPSFVAGLLFVIPVKFLAGFYTPENFWAAIGLFIGGVDESGHLWFLWALFWVMIIFVALQKVTEKFTTDSPTILLIFTWILQMYAYNIPITAFQFNAAIKYVFWFACGYVFEKYCRQSFSLKQGVLVFLLTSILEYVQMKHPLFTNDTLTMLGIIWTISLSQILATLLATLYDTKIFKLILRNLFNIYLFHDPLNYVILKFTFKFNILETSVGCWIYLFARTFGVIIVSVLIGELIRSIMKIVKHKNRG